MVMKTALFERLVHGLYFYVFSSVCITLFNFLAWFLLFLFFFFALKITRILLIRYDSESEECATMPLYTDMQPCWDLA